MSRSGNASRWHDDTITQSLKCAEKQTPVFFSPSQAYVAAPGAVLTFEFSFRTNPVALFTWGQGKGWGCYGNPCRWSHLALGEMSTGRGGGNSSASLFSSLSLIETQFLSCLRLLSRSVTAQFIQLMTTEVLSTFTFSVKKVRKTKQIPTLLCILQPPHH